MPYLPIDVVHTTEFVEAWGKDLFFQVRKIEEAWNRHYPNVEYSVLKKATVPVANVNVPSGEAGTSYFDPMWGETIDSARAVATGAWEQPHASTTGAKATSDDVDVFDPAVAMRSQVTRLGTSDAVHKFGFDSTGSRIIGLGLTVPLSFLDRLGVTIGAGDKFTWDGDEWEVLVWRTVRFWANSNIRLYMKIGADYRRKGS